MKKCIAPLILAAFFFSCPSDSGGGGPVDVAVPADLMGMVHAGTRTLIAADANAAAHYDLLDEIGIIWTLTDFSWGTIQGASEQDKPPAEWNWSGFDNYVQNGNERGKKILAILDYDTDWLHGGKTGEKVTVRDHMGSNVQVDVFADGHIGRCIIGDDEIERFCTYVKATVSRYNGANGHGKVDAWNIWNEPNLFPRFWTGTMDEFFKLSIAAAKAVREIDPNAIIVAGALNSTAGEEWIRGLYKSGAMKQADFTGFHPYSPGPQGTAGIYQFFLDKSAAAFRNKVWVTEVGHPTTGGERGDSIGYGTEIHVDQMPQAIVKTVVLLAVKGAQKIFWYHLADSRTPDPADSEDWFGLYATNADGSYRPKGHLPATYKLVAEHIPGKTWRASGLPGLKLPDTVQSYYFESPDGKCLLVVWNNSLMTAPTVDITLPGAGHILHNPADATAAPVPASDTYPLTIRDSADERVLFFTWTN